MKIERLPSEDYIEYARRLTDMVSDGVLNWQEWSDNLVGENVYVGEACVRSGRFFRKWLEKYDESPEKSLEKVADKNAIERQKIQDANKELRKTYRQIARHELFSDRLIEAIEHMPKIEFGNATHENSCKDDSTAFLCIADAHYGTEIDIRDVFGNVVNQYNPEIFRERLNDILKNLVNDKSRYFGYKTLHVIDFGDCIQNYLRLSDVSRNQVGVIDSIMEYAEIMSKFLAELVIRLKVDIVYHVLSSNHDTMRLLNGKPNFEEEDCGKIIRELIALRLQDYRRFITIAPFSETMLVDIDGYKIMAYHGHNSKNANKEYAYWQNINKIDIDLLLLGHLHHGEMENIGIDAEVCRVPSIVGIDDFSCKCRKVSNAGVKFFIVENGEKTFERTYRLN